jgi:hypothetical protein
MLVDGYELDGELISDFIVSECLPFAPYLTMGNDEQLQKLIDNNIINILLTSCRLYMGDEILFALRSLSNLIAGSSERLQSILNSGLITAILYIPATLLVDEQRSSVDCHSVCYHLIVLFEYIFDVATEKQLIQLIDAGLITTLLILITHADICLPYIAELKRSTFDTQFPFYLLDCSMAALLNMFKIIYSLCAVDIRCDDYKKTIESIQYHCSKELTSELEVPNIHCFIRMENKNENDENDENDEHEENEENEHNENEDDENTIIYKYNPPSFNSRHLLYIFGIPFLQFLSYSRRYSSHIDSIKIILQSIDVEPSIVNLSSTWCQLFDQFHRIEVTIYPVDLCLLESYLIEYNDGRDASHRIKYNDILTSTKKIYTLQHDEPLFSYEAHRAVREQIIPYIRHTTIYEKQN